MLNEVLLLIFRCLFSYVLAIVIFRFMGKREIGEMSIFDLIIFLMMAEIISLGIEDADVPLWRTFIALITLGVLQRLIAMGVRKDNRFQRMLEGIPSIIVKHGQLNIPEMKKLEYTVYDLMQQLRQQSVSDLRDVDFAVLEVNGELSVFQKNSSGGSKQQQQQPKFTLPLIVDGEIQYDYLKMLGYTPKWLIEKLADNGHGSIESLMYCSYRDREFYIQKK